ncbi:MAG TPA: DUF4386 domain-containing protein [Pyrinomonadaceae bacterium]|jgi:hypothetical protein|nr:DUF4386 domain-containing protein [Pyrinomonadaceae bacterium]
MNPTKKTARIAGLFLFLMALTGGFGIFYIRNYVIAPGDAAATAGNILADEFLFRVAITCVLFAQIFMFFLGLTLFHLFKETDRWLATVLLTAIMMTLGIGVINQLNNFGALLILSQPDYLKVFTTEQLNALAMFLLRQANGTGQGLLEIFWVPYYFSFGLLIVRSRYLPKILGILLMIASVGFAANLLDKFLVPQFYPAAFTQLAMTLSAVGVLPTMLWLLIMGANVAPPSRRLS